MNKTLTRPRALWGAAVAIAALAISTVTPIASANTYSAPSAPTNVVATASATGIKVRWTKSADVNPAITHYIISAGAGSCPIISRATNPASVTLPVLAGQTTITPVVQAVNAYGISAAAKANKSFTAASLVGTMIRTDLKSVQFLQFSDFHGALEASATSMGAAVMASSFAAERAKNPTTITVSSVLASTTNKKVVISVDATRPDSSAVVTGSVQFRFAPSNLDASVITQLVSRETSGRWKIAVAGIPAGSWLGNVEFKDASGTHSDIFAPIAFTVEQGPTPTPKPTKKPAPKPVFDSCRNQIKN